MVGRSGVRAYLIEGLHRLHVQRVSTGPDIALGIPFSKVSNTRQPKQKAMPHPYKISGHGSKSAAVLKSFTETPYMYCTAAAVNFPFLFMAAAP